MLPLLLLLRLLRLLPPMPTTIDHSAYLYYASYHNERKRESGEKRYWELRKNLSRHLTRICPEYYILFPWLPSCASVASHHCGCVGIRLKDVCMNTWGHPDTDAWYTYAAVCVYGVYVCVCVFALTHFVSNSDFQVCFYTELTIITICLSSFTRLFRLPFVSTCAAQRI